MRLDHLLSKEQTIISGFGAVCVPAMVCSRVKHKKSISITAGEGGAGVGGGCASDRRPGLLHTIGVLRKHRPVPTSREGVGGGEGFFGCSCCSARGGRETVGCWVVWVCVV